jgi:hypothetical protein
LREAAVTAEQSGMKIKNSADSGRKVTDDYTYVAALRVQRRLKDENEEIKK